MDDVRARAIALLDAELSRGALKRAAAELDADGQLRLAVLQEASRRGHELPDEAEQWAGKKLLRRARGRDRQAQVRTNPIHRDEAFTCAHCQAQVPPHGRTARDHCPHCLRSLHVDVVPGDRAADCGGVLDPVAVEPIGGGDWRIRYRCRACGADRVNRALLDGEDPDEWRLIVALSGAR